MCVGGGTVRLFLMDDQWPPEVRRGVVEGGRGGVGYVC